MIGYLTLSSNTAGALSTWTGYQSGYGEVRYTTPTVDSQTISVSVPAEMAGATINSVTLTYNVSSGSGTRKVCYSGGAVNVTNANLLERLQAGQSLDMYFQFKATGGTGGEGTHSASCTWSNISIAVDYTPAANMTRTFTLSGAGTVTLSVDRDSLAYGETANLSVGLTASAAVSGVTTEIRPAGLSEQVTFTDSLTLSAGSSASRAHELAITSAMQAAMTERVYGAQYRVTVTLSGGSTVTSGWAWFTNASSKSFTLLTSRTAPQISAVSFGESGSSHLSAYGDLIAGKTVPTISFSVTLDTAADSGISCQSRQLVLDNRTYNLSGNGGTLQPVGESGNVSYTITVTDSYGQVGTLTGSVTVLAYAPPRLTGLAIARYVSSLNAQGQTVYELDDDGDKLWLDAVIAVQAALGSGVNAWTLTITPAGGSAVTVVSDSSLASKTFEHDRSVLTGTYANTSEHVFTVELSDQFTTLTYSVRVPKAGGIFNVELTGVAVGMRSTGSEASPIFESAYPAYFRGGLWGADGKRIDQADDTGWVALTLTNCAQASGWAACAVRRIRGVVYLRGAVTLSASMPSSASASRQLTTLPEGYRPAANMLAGAGARSNISSVEIDAGGAVLLWNRIGAAIGTSEVISLTAVFPAD